MSRRKYSDIEKAEAIAAVKSNGGNIFRTSHELNIPWQTLANWVKGTNGLNDSIPKLGEEKEQELAVICENVARKYLRQAGDEYVIAAVPGNLAMTAAGIAIDKAQLLRGQPTQITSEVESRKAFMVTVLNRMKQKHDGDPEGYAADYYQLQQFMADKSEIDYHPDYDPANPNSIWREVPAELIPQEIAPLEQSEAEN